MKNLLIGLVLTTAMTAHAQTSQSSTAAAAPAQTSTAKAPTPSKLGANLIFQSWMSVSDLKENGRNSPIDSDNGIGLTYKLTDKMKTEIRYRFGLKTAADREVLRDKKTGEIPDIYKTLDPTIHLNYKSDLSLFGSKPMSFGSRYYIPASESSQDKTSMGTLRAQTSLDWELNPKVSVSALTDVRLTGYRSFETKGGTGTDSVLLFLAGVAGTYNFSDALSAYYQPYVVTEGTGFQRGQLTADRTNVFTHEVGLNYTVGAVTINPAYDTTGSASGEEGLTYKGAGADANSNYYLNVFASF